MITSATMDGASPPAPTGAAQLASVLLASDQLTVSAAGVLHIDGWAAPDLLVRFGSPLNVIVERTLCDNFHRITAAFATRWPAPVRILYSIKANNTLAIRAILSREGAGSDCFGLGELQATLRGGTDPALVAINGSDKSPAEVRAAVEAGVTLNIDGVDELGAIADACRAGHRARVNLRLKLLPPALDDYIDALHPTPGGFVEGVRRVKWGFSIEAAIQLVRALLAMPEVDLLGYSCHIGHLSSHKEASAVIAAAMGEAVGVIGAATGFWPTVLDLGGGWAPERDPSFRRAGLVDIPIEQTAQATADALRAALPAGMAQPALWIEPGRFIVSNAVLLLARVGAVKRDAGLCWMHLDASTNNLPRIESGRFHYTILPASRMHDPAGTVLDVVGGTCFRSVLGAARAWPAPRRGDVAAILDAGMYAEVFANQFNSVPRPATILLSTHGAEVVRVRETIDDVFRQQRMPAWLSPA